jgi:hypothetical protein
MLSKTADEMALLVGHNVEEKPAKTMVWAGDVVPPYRA